MFFILFFFTVRHPHFKHLSFLLHIYSCTNVFLQCSFDKA
uniref:Uncharacterized protein n=1 Tax=Rhizophora mucronata TaxID=61149 RepID=A0A2P2QG94_RHIMU